jgi:beta-glucosidase
MVPAYLNPSQSVEERVQDLLSRMTLQEKVHQMGNRCPAIPRLGLPEYDYWSEALHGIARNGRATVFPQAIGLAATWDPILLEKIASAIGNEGRAKFHAAIRYHGCTGSMEGLTFWSPNINIFRDPRWGRGQETYGEDPFLTSEMGLAYVRGLQGDDPRYLRAAACAKHFAVHSGPEAERHRFNAQVSLRELHDTYLPAFKRLVEEGQVEAVMGAYNRVNGESACANRMLLTDLLRDQWRFQGHVVSDCGALDNIQTGDQPAPDEVRAAAMSLKAGCDLCCGDAYDHLVEAVQLGLVSEEEINLSLARSLRTRFRLGMFDPPNAIPFASIPEAVIGCAKHRRLAEEAALKSIVLLKNKNKLLPLRTGTRQVLVVGPNAASLEALLGNYNGLNETMTTFVEGLVGLAPKEMCLSYRLGVPLQQSASGPDWTLSSAASAEVTIACMGSSPLLEGEEGDPILSAFQGDRPDLGLPLVQREFLHKLAATGTRVVLVLCGGGPISLGELEDKMDAVLFAWYPGQAGGRALARILFGDACPSGKLPVTFPRSTEQLPPFDDYHMDHRTYRYSTAEPLFPFGFGLSYTCFEFGGLKLENNRLRPGEALAFRLEIRNVGDRPGEEVVQVYLSDIKSSTRVPLHKLVGFRRVHLPACRGKTLRFVLPASAMTFVDESGNQVLEPGRFRLTVGSCSPGERGSQLGAPASQSAFFEVI